MNPATPPPASYATLAVSAFRMLLTLVTTENPLIWPFFGGRNDRADVEGPFYVLGAPKVEFAEGKAILAPLSLLKKFRPFLMTVRVLSPDGRPLKGATLDWWQADPEGTYYFSTYTLRGRVSTDKDGVAEVITVAPGVYGALGVMRAGHFHVKIYPPKPEKGAPALEELTTQIYICKENDVQILKGDLVNYMRKLRINNMAQAWSLPSKDFDDGKAHMGLPEIADSEGATKERAQWYNESFERNGLPELKIAAGAETEIRLSAKGWL